MVDCDTGQKEDGYQYYARWFTVASSRSEVIVIGTSARKYLPQSHLVICIGFDISVAKACSTTFTNYFILFVSHNYLSICITVPSIVPLPLTG